ncbi:MAG: glycoside hydrolase domain-containing protein [Planctomycetota bacterium]
MKSLRLKLICELFVGFILVFALPCNADGTEPPWTSDPDTAALFHFDESNVNNVIDSSGNGAVFTPGSTASMTTEGMFTNALSLAPRTSTSQPKTTIQLPGGVMNPGSFCIDLWFRINSSGAPPETAKYIFSSSNCFLRYRYNGARNMVLNFGLIAEDETGFVRWIEVSTNVNIFKPRPNTWYYVVCNYDGTKISLYVDGALIDTAVATGVISHTSYVLGGVGWANELKTELDGYIDELRFSKVARQGFYKNPKIDIRTYPAAGSGHAIIWTYDANGAASPARLEMTVLDSQSQVVSDANNLLPGQLPAETWLPLSILENDANYTVEVSIVGDDGFGTACESVEFHMPERPEWADTNAGELNGTVLEPWTPIEANGTAISCWGRTYDLGDSLLPVSIISSGHQITSDRLGFTVGHGGATETLDHAQSPASITVSPTGDIAEFSASATSSYCDVNIAGTLEFDGFMTFDVTILPNQPIDTFTLDIPLTNELAKYIQPTQSTAYGDPAGTIPDTGTTYYSLNDYWDWRINSTWICNGQAGFFFIVDSSEYIKTDNDPEIKLVRRGADTLVSIRLYDSAESFNSERHYRFRLQATPIRPFNPDWHETGCMTMTGLNWGINVTPLEDDTVLSLSMAMATYAPQGMFEIIVNNKNNLKEIIEMPYPHWGANEKIGRITDASQEISLLFQKEYSRNAMVLQTPWGSIWEPNNCPWEPNETHKLAFTWGDKLRFYVDGALQGSLSVTGLPMQYPSCKLGSVSARYIMKQLRVSKVVDINSLSSIDPMPQTPDTILIYNNELDLRSDAQTPLHEARDLGIKAMNIFESWCQNESGGVSIYEPLVRNIVEDCHRLGMKVYIYFGFQMADVPEFADMIYECRSGAYRPADYYSPQSQYCYHVSYGGPYQEYLLYHMKRLKEKMGIDGVYLDGSISIIGSDNPAFGCGFVDVDGNRQVTIPIDRIRSFAKRINNLFVQDGGIIYAHLGISPPTMGFATNIFYGEHVGFLNPWESVMDRIPLNTAQTVYNSNNTGVPVILCLHNAWPHLRYIVPNWYALASAWGDIHRIFLPSLLETPMADEMVDMIVKKHKLDEFGADESEWIPYWQTEGSIITQPADTFKVSGYRRVDGAVVCAIMNNTGQQANGWVDLCGTALQPRPGQTCQQLVSGDPVTFADNKIYVDIPAYEGLLVRIGGEYPVADLSHDWCIDFNDLAVFTLQWLESGSIIDADFNQDGNVDLVDLSVFCDYWLTCDMPW